MARVVIIYWDAWDEKRARSLRESHDIEIVVPKGMPELRALGDAPLDTYAAVTIVEP